MKKIILVFAAALFTSACFAGSEGNAAALVKAAVAGDTQCIVSNVTEHVVGGKKVTEVFFVLTPGKRSYIRCKVALPAKGEWSGRLWGFGCGGWAGTVPGVVGPAAKGDAAVSSDMGTGWTTGWTRKHFPEPWPDDVWKDFGWRSTHLMTVYAKKFCKAFYGREPDYSYFKGASTGGGQGIHEALRFPGDYDGIISELPANSRVSLEASAFHRLKLQQRLKLDDRRRKILADAPIEFMADKDAPFARGKYLSDPRMCEGSEEAIFDVAARKDPVFSEPGVRAALRELFSGPVHRQRRSHGGYCWGAEFAGGSGLFLFNIHYTGKYKRKFDAAVATWDDFDDFVAARKDDINATGTDFSAFAKRGGKIIMTAGLEDQTIPFASIIDHYEETAARAGGIGRLREYFRLYLIPGCAHGGIGREFTSCPVPDIKGNIIDWVEKGIAPESIRPKSKKGKIVDIPAYPEAVTENGKVGIVPRGGVREIHSFYR